MHRAFTFSAHDSGTSTQSSKAAVTGRHHMHGHQALLLMCIDHLLPVCLLLTVPTFEHPMLSCILPFADRLHLHGTVNLSAKG